MKKITLAILALFSLVVLYGQQNPGGITGSQAWMQTSYKNEDIFFEWKDFSGDSVRVYESSSKELHKEYRVRYVNFNPALYVDSNSYQKWLLECTNLSQGTIISFFMPRKNFSSDKVLYGVSGRPQEGFITTADQIYGSNSSGMLPLDYGKEEGRDLRYKEEDLLEKNQRTFQETSARILSYLRYTQPNHSVWGERQQTVLLTGNYEAGKDELSSSFTDAISETNFEGFIGETIIFDRILTPEERRKVETYLALKYGVTLDKSYVSSWDTTLWELSENVLYNNRITGILRDTRSGLYQPLSTTTYEEATSQNYFSYNYNTYDDVGDSDAQEVSNLPITSFRLLALGLERTSELLKNDQTYAIWGDNSGSLKTSSSSKVAGLSHMARTWRVRTNIEKVDSTRTRLNWQVKDLQFEGGNWSKQAVFLNESKASEGGAVTEVPLKGKEGVLGFVSKSNINRAYLKFGTQQSSLSANSHDYGVILRRNRIYGMSKGKQMRLIGFYFDNDSFEMIKNDSVIRFKKNGTLLSYTLPIAKEDRNKPFYGSVHIEKSLFRNTYINNIYHRGFVEDGMQLELSYGRERASDLEPDKLYADGYAPYLIIDKTGEGNFDNPDNLTYVPVSRVDRSRKKLEFHNFFIDADQSGMDAFTFGYKKPIDFIAYIDSTLPTCVANDTITNKDGALQVRLTDGQGPFTYQLLGTNKTSYSGTDTTVSGREFGIPNLDSGTYRLTITDTGKKQKLSKDVTLVTTCTTTATTDSSSATPVTGVEAPATVEESDKVVAYPVPARSGEPFTIRVETKESFTAYLYNLRGSLISTQKVQSNGSDIQSVVARLYTSSSYIVKVVTSSGEVLMKKIIVN